MARDATLDLSFASYNIHRCTGADGRYDLARTAAVIKSLNADVVALQEIGSYAGGSLKSATPSDLPELARAAGYEGIACPTLIEGSGPFGNALLVRVRPREIRRFDLTGASREQRAALEIEIACGDGMKVRVINTHLGNHVAERRSQVERLLQLVGPPCEDTVTILMGDFNEWVPMGRSLRPLDERFGKQLALRTYPASLPVLALDRIWVSPPQFLKTLQLHDSPHARLASDHLPIKAVVGPLPGAPVVVPLVADVTFSAGA